MSRDGATTASTSAIVWATADKFLRYTAPSSEYGDYILPFTVLRRLECVLEANKDEVRAYVSSLGDLPAELLEAAVKKKFGLSFYNLSPFTLESIASVDDHVSESLMAYVEGFSANVVDIWEHFKFPTLVAQLEDTGRLLGMVRHFSTIDLSTEHVSDTAMGDIFENVMYRAFDKKGQDAGAFYTPRDAIRLMVDVLLASDEEALASKSALRSIYDPTAGSGGMLLVGAKHLKELNPDARVTLYGQEVMPAAYALGKADLLIHGERPDAILKGNTLREDLFENLTFDYVLSNPPFGTDWSDDHKEVRDQAAKPGSRFSHGLPPKSDGQMLFLAHCATKLSPATPDGQGGRAAVVSNASPLFASGAGQTAIRQWLFEEDLIDAIIALPTSMFYNTGIATYVWILDRNKEEHRQGKIQLIDASNLWEPMRKPLGDKRREVTEEGRRIVLEAYKDFEQADPTISRVLTPEELMFTDVPVFKQARLKTVVTDQSLGELAKRAGFTTAHADIVRNLDGSTWSDLPSNLTDAAKTAGVKFTATMIDAVMTQVGVPDPDAPLAVNRKGNPALAEDWKITERVPATEDINDHMAREVLPFAPGAMWDETKARPGNEIPFTRIFYIPEEPRPLAEIDADVQRIMGELAEMFQEVSGE